MKIYPNQKNFEKVEKYVEKRFNQWFEHNTQPSAPGDYEAMYYGEFGQEPIYSKADAIAQAIEEMINEAEQTGQPVNVRKFDIEASFE